MNSSSKTITRRNWKPVTDAQFQKALADSDVMNLLASESGKYRHQLDAHVVESLRLYSLWKTLACHDENDPSRQKFTTSLYRIIHWEFRRALRDYARQERKELFNWEGDLEDLESHQTPDDSDTQRANTQLLQFIQDQGKYLPRSIWSVVHGHYFEGKSIKELSILFNLNPHSVHKRIRWGIRRLRELCLDGYDLKDVA